MSKEMPNLCDDKYSILYCHSHSDYKPDYVWDDDERSCSATPVRKYNKSFIESDEDTKSLAQIMKEYYDEERSIKYNNNNNNNHSQEPDIYYGNPPIIYSPDLPKSSESAQVDTDIDDNHVESTEDNTNHNVNEDGEDDNTKNKFYDDIIYKKFCTS